MTVTVTCKPLVKPEQMDPDDRADYLDGMIPDQMTYCFGRVRNKDVAAKLALDLWHSDYAIASLEDWEIEAEVEA